MKDKKNLYYLGGAILAYFVILKPIFKKLGLSKTQQDIINEKEKQKFLTGGGSPTKTPGEWVIIADQIHEDLRYSSLDDDKADAGYQVSRVKNNADFKLLYSAFGKRREYFFGIPSGSEKDLQQFIRSNLNDSDIQIINKNYRDKKITFQF